jgi:hypothetical protein
MLSFRLQRKSMTKIILSPRAFLFLMLHLVILFPSFALPSSLYDFEHGAFLGFG